MGGIIYFLGLEESFQPLIPVLWGLRDAKNHCCQPSEPQGVGQAGDRQCTGRRMGQMGGGCDFTGRWQKKGFWGELPQLWALCSYLCIYLANFGQKRDSGGHPFRSLDWTQIPRPSIWTFLNPASLCQGLATWGTDIQKLFSLGSVPSAFYTSPQVLCQAGALPM